jgi:diguanylate cyclase (GGDEF)-like protein
MVDIDDFKEFNDNYGHLRGDKALRSVAKVITQPLKRPGDLVARWGGEEFIVLLPNTDSKGAFIIADQIRRAVEATPVHIDDDIYAPIMVSIGTNTLYPSQDKNTDDFIQHTDNALYTAKRDGKNRVYCLNTI